MINILQSSVLFSGYTPEQLNQLLPCLDSWEKTYDKGEYLMRMGDKAEMIGMVLSGSVHVIEEDFWGNRNIITELGIGEVFAESYACANSAPIQVDVVTQEKTTVLYIYISKLLTPCGKACDYHISLIRRLVGMLAQKNLFLNEKLRHVTRRTTRERVLSYLSAIAAQKGKAEFDIPFNRQQLADYLAVDRSAMSSELGKLRDEGTLTFHKNHFTLMQ